MFIHDTTVGAIVKETIKIICDVLHEMYMYVPTTPEQWKMITDRFENLWDLPNCIGALDRKYMQIGESPNPGSENYSYKHFHSTILLAYYDVYTVIKRGWNSDEDIFNAIAIKYWMAYERFTIDWPF